LGLDGESSWDQTTQAAVRLLAIVTALDDAAAATVSSFARKCRSYECLAPHVVSKEKQLHEIWQQSSHHQLLAHSLDSLCLHQYVQAVSPHMESVIGDH